jgi:hypothetical protein
LRSAIHALRFGSAAAGNKHGAEVATLEERAKGAEREQARVKRSYARIYNDAKAETARAERALMCAIAEKIRLQKLCAAAGVAFKRADTYPRK